jgi:DNA-binding MarR family transcriptional regulator
MFLMETHTDKARSIMKIMKSAQDTVNARYMQHLLPHQLTVAQYKTLQHLYWSKEGMMIGELSEHLGLANSTVSSIVDRLERDNWTQRRRSDDDRRKIKVILTDKAIELFRQAPKDAEEFWSNTIGRLSAEEQDALVESLIKLKNVIEKPTWPSFEQLHPKSEKYTKERIHADLEEIFSIEVSFIGKCLVLAKMAEEESKPEVAAYLKQVASEEIIHALSAAKLMGRNADIKQNLIELAKEKVNSREIRENLTKVATEEQNPEILDFLSKMVADEANHKRWLKMLLRRVESENNA